MKKQINPTIKAYLIRSAFYLLLLIAVCAIPFALAQRNGTKRSVAKSAANQTVNTAVAGPHAAPPASLATDNPPSSIRERGSEPAAPAHARKIVLPRGTCPNPWQEVAPMPTDLYGDACASDGTFVYCGGGYSFSQNTTLAVFNQYDPVANTWTSLPNMPQAAAEAVAVYYPTTNRIYIFGGEDAVSGTNYNITRIYDIASNTWTTGANMPDVRSFAAGGFISATGKIYIISGYNTGTVDSAQPNTWAYDPVADSWTDLTGTIPFPHPAGGMAFGVVNNKLYIAGGRDAANTIINLNWEFDPSVPVYNSKADEPGTYQNNVPGSAAALNALWVFGGGNPFIGGSATKAASKAAFPWAFVKGVKNRPRIPATDNETRFYDPSTDTWGPFSNMNEFRAFPGGAAVGATLVATGGYNGSTTVASVEATTACFPTPTPPQCDTGAIQNEGFETGDFTSWTIDGNNATPVVTNTQAHTGTFSGFAGDAPDGFCGFPGVETTGDSSFYQQFTVPAGTSTLTFWHWDCTTDSITFDWQDAYIADSSGNILQTIFHQCLNGMTWIQQNVDMTPYAGQTVRIKFLVHEDGFGDLTGMYVDDVQLTVPCGTPTPTPTCAPGLLVGSGMTLGFAPNGWNPTLATNTVNYTFANSQAAPNDFALFDTHDPWGFTILKDAITGAGHTYTEFTPAQLAGFPFNQYRVVVCNWDDTFLTDFIGPYAAAIPMLEAYVNAGGVVWVQGAIQGSPGDNYPMPFGGLGLGADFSTSDNIVDPSSPMMTGMPNPIPGNDASHVDYTGLPGAAHIVVVNPNDNNPVVYDLRPGGGGCASPTPTATFTPTPTPTASPTCMPGGTPGPWMTASPYPMTIVRYGFAQTATDFYVFGGVSNGTRQSAVNSMDLATGMWQSRAPMPFTSEAPTCALMESTGIVYCAEGDQGNSFASYDIATDTWTPLANTPNGDDYGSASGAFNGKVFLAGGTTGFINNVWVYDVGTNTWSAGTAAPDPFLLAGYKQVGQFLYLVGGWTGGAPNGLTTTRRLDMSSAPGVWENGPTFTMGRADFGLAYDAGTNKLYALGGDLCCDGNFFNSTNEVDEVDLSGWPGGTWVMSPPNLPLPNRQANQSGFYGNGDIWSVGGIVGQTFQFLADVYDRTNGGVGCASPTPTATFTPTPTATATFTPSATATATATPTPTSSIPPPRPTPTPRPRPTIPPRP